MSRNIVFEGWLTKSPPSKRIWRTKWRRRWFALRQSGELPGQYFLDYYADRNCRRLKGTINLDLCEQVDAGLHMERAGNGTLDPKLRGSVFTIQTQSRTYHLEADCEAEMEKWVAAICRSCGLRPSEAERESLRLEVYQGRAAVSPRDEHYDRAASTGPYIPISECITGVRAHDQQRAFTFDPGNIMMSTHMSSVVTNQPHRTVTNADFSENESNLSEEDCKSLNASHSNIPDCAVTKSFSRLAVSPNKNGLSDDSSVGPPVPPRPPKTFARSKGPKIQEPLESVQESIANYNGPGTPWLRVPRRMSQGAAPHSPGRLFTVASNNLRYTDDEEESTPGNQSMQYYNLSTLPPAVDRALKPRSSIGHLQSYMSQPQRSRSHPRIGRSKRIVDEPTTQRVIAIANVPEVAEPVYEEGHSPNADELKAESLQYLDLDLHTTQPPASNNYNRSRRLDIAHGKSMSAVEADSAYKTVDFLKTEAFNITRQDAEASRSHQN